MVHAAHMTIEPGLFPGPLGVAVEHAFSEAGRSVANDGGVTPFTISCTADGFDVVDHPGSSIRDIYRSVRSLLARSVPDAYVFMYDGCVDTDSGRQRALIGEIARRGERSARVVALTYRERAGEIVFAPSPIDAGAAPSLYPAGEQG